MKIAIISDLHLEFLSGGSPNKLLKTFTHEKYDDVDVWINAGDTHPDTKKRNNFCREAFGHRDVYIEVYGNHDYWGGSFNRYTDEQKRTLIEVDGVKFAAATLWTHPVDHITWMSFIRDYLNDALWIEDYDFATYTAEWMNDSEFLMKSDADVYVTHHVPFYDCIHERYKNRPIETNYGFWAQCDSWFNDPDWKPPKLWVYGHTHDTFDGEVGGIRCVNNAHGYPNERSRIPHRYEPKIVEI